MRWNDQVRVWEVGDHRVDAARGRVAGILENVGNILNLSPALKQKTLGVYDEEVAKKTRLDFPDSVLAACLWLASREINQDPPLTLTRITEEFEQVGYQVAPEFILYDWGTCANNQIEGREGKSPEQSIECLLVRVAKYPNLAGRVQKKAGLTFDQYFLVLSKVSRHLVAHFPTLQGGKTKSSLLAAAIIYVADRVLAKKLGTPPVLTHDILVKVTGESKISLHEQVRYFSRHLKGKDISEIWEGQGAPLDVFGS